MFVVLGDGPWVRGQVSASFLGRPDVGILVVRKMLRDLFSG